MFCKEDSNVMKISILEQFNILNEQIKDIYGLISSVHKYYSALCSSIVGIAILLYSNDVKPSENFNYLYYIVMLVYTLSIVWYRNLLVYLHDLNSITDEYNKFIEINHIISMYRLSYRRSRKFNNINNSFKTYSKYYKKWNRKYRDIEFKNR